ncbi:MAG: hypothetical protein ACFFCB_06945, partial [Candidatus Odinarchaeota archaeon]
RGYRGQRIHVLPNENLVVVFTASGSQVNYDALIEEYIMPAVNEFQPLVFTSLTTGLIVVMIIGIPLTIGGVYLLRKRYGF